MGYAKSIKWNDDLIKREILEAKNALEKRIANIINILIGGIM